MFLCKENTPYLTENMYHILIFGVLKSSDYLNQLHSKKKKSKTEAGEEKAYYII